MSDLHFLFLQGLPCPFFSRIADGLAARGCKATGINLCFGDRLFWRGPNTVNYRGRIADWPAFIDRYMATHGVTDIVLLGEQRGYHKEAIAAAKARNIRVTVTDFGYLRPDWITLERDGMGGDSHFPKDPDVIRQLAAAAGDIDFAVKYTDSFWTMALADMLYHLGNLLLFWLYPHYRRPYRRDPALLHYPAIGLRLLKAGREARRAERCLAALVAEQAEYFVFPLQLENDFQIVSYSPFDSLDAAIELVITSFANHAKPHSRLLIKVHPLEPGIKNWRRLIAGWAERYGVAGRIDYVDGGSLDDMIRGAAGMITVNSTSGIRALQLGCPVKTLGDAVYDVAGLTCQDSLDRFWGQPAMPDAELVRAFLSAVAATIQVRGVFYSDPGLQAAVEEAVERLYTARVGML